MSEAKNIEAAVEAAARAYGCAPQNCDGNEAMAIALAAALPHLHPHPAELAFDVEAMLAACVPGGSIVDPQVVADNIRSWAAERKPAELAQSPTGHELAYAVEKALGNRDGKRDAELDELLAMAMNELNAINTDLPAELAEQQGDLVNPNDCESGPSGEWYCEAHPDALMGHGNCGGAGIPASARLQLALNWLRLERQKVRELHAQYGYLAEAALAATGQPQVGEVQGTPKIAAVMDRCIRELRSFIDFAHDYDLDEMEVQALETAIESMELHKKPAQGIDLGQLPDGWSLRTLATCYQLSDGNQVVGNFVGPDAKKNAALIAALIEQRDAAPGVGNE